MNKYDEILSENKFFKCLKEDHFELFKEAAIQGYLICIPKSNVVYDVQVKTILDHILIPVQKNSNNNEYLTKNENKLVLQNGQIISNINFNRYVNILFEETFYDEAIGKFRVLCVDGYISSLFREGYSQNQNSSLNIKYTLKNLCTINDFITCISDLVNDSSVFDEIDKYLSDILSLPFSKVNPPETNHLRTLVHDMLKKASKYLLELNIKLTEKEDLILNMCIESYILHNLYNILFQYSALEMSSKDEKFNRILHSFKEVTEIDLNIHVTNMNCILSARYELAAINNFKSPFGKLQCIKKTIDCFETESNLTLDELLPILVLTIIKCNLSTWFANLNFIETYSFNLESNSEYFFILSTFEAALVFIFSEELKKLTMSSNYVQSSKQEATFCIDTFNPKSQRYCNDVIYTLYDHIKKDNLKGVKCTFEARELEKSLPKKYVNQDPNLDLCHPLCVCSECRKIVQESVSSNFILDYNNKDEYIMTPLHIAAWYGSLSIVEYLLSKNVNLNNKNIVGMTPLHIAAYKGHQTTLLMLLNAGCEIDSADSTGNTALQLACTAGHDNCVKALIFYAESIGYKYNFGKKNIYGDTALHLATFWGYMNIVKFLLSQPRVVTESIRTKNLRNQTPLDCAHNQTIASLIEETLENIEENAHTNLLLLNLEEEKIAKTDFETKVCDRHVQSVTYEYEKTNNKHLDTKKNSSDSEVKNLLTKILNAIKVGDNRLALFYLEINENESDNVESSKCHPLCQCTDCSNISITSLNRRKSLINFSGDENYGILHTAVLKGDIELCQTLLEHGADPQALTKSQMRSSLHLSVLKENVELMKLLIKFKADLNCPDIMGNTPLHLCCINGWKEGVITLIESGAEFNVYNKEGSSPKEEADINGYFEIVVFLVRKMSEVLK